MLFNWPWLQRGFSPLFTRAVQWYLLTMELVCMHASDPYGRNRLLKWRMPLLLLFAQSRNTTARCCGARSRQQQQLWWAWIIEHWLPKSCVFALLYAYHILQQKRIQNPQQKCFLHRVSLFSWEMSICLAHFKWDLLSVSDFHLSVKLNPEVKALSNKNVQWLLICVTVKTVYIFLIHSLLLS